ncbi:glycosyltransferase family A protein [soil metagenome]
MTAPERRPGPITLVHVVVPAHDEERFLGRALEAITVASTRARAEQPGLTVRTTVVLDSCTDGTAEVAAAHAVDLRVVDAGCVGAARHAGTLRVRDVCRGVPGEEVWVLCTDADSVVPETWVVDHLRLARSHDVVLGGARPDPGETPADHLAEWERRHRFPRRRVHGANLGFRLSTYLSSGGFEPLDEHEDVRLVEAFDRLGAAIGVGTEVITSSRHTGRTPGGFAGYMARLAMETTRPGLAG